MFDLKGFDMVGFMKLELWIRKMLRRVEPAVPEYMGIIS
jgi:hypothetical protein